MKTLSPSDDGLLLDAVRRLVKEQGFMANLIATAMPGEISAERIAQELGCTRRDGIRLALMRAPSADRFREDVALIAAAVQVDAKRLTALVRQAQSLEAFADEGVAEATLMAARDHVPDGGEVE